MSKYLETLVIDDQAYLAKDENLEKVFGVMKSICKFADYEELIEALDKVYPEVIKLTGSLERWDKISSAFNLKKKDHIRVWEMIKKELTIGLLYPKIDSHVSAQANHLLKCPFNVHHDTGKLSLPILDVENFDVNSCLTIFDVLENKERLDPYLKAFDAFCEPLVN